MSEEVLTPEEGTEQEEQETLETPQTDWQAEAERLKAEKEAIEKRYSESSREAQLLHESNKSFKEQLDKLTNQEAPNEAEMQSLYPGWQDLSAADQNFLRDQQLLKKRQAATEKMLIEMQESRKREDDLYRVRQNYPEIAANEADFKAFANKPTHRNIDIDILAQSFLFQHKPKPEAKPEAKGSILEKGSGGVKEAPKVYTDDDLTAIRTSDPKRYRELLVKGLI